MNMNMIKWALCVLALTASFDVFAFDKLEDAKDECVHGWYGSEKYGLTFNRKNAVNEDSNGFSNPSNNIVKYRFSPTAFGLMDLNDRLRKNAIRNNQKEGDAISANLFSFYERINKNYYPHIKKGALSQILDSQFYSLIEEGVLTISNKQMYASISIHNSIVVNHIVYDFGEYSMLKGYLFGVSIYSTADRHYADAFIKTDTHTLNEHPKETFSEKLHKAFAMMNEKPETLDDARLQEKQNNIKNIQE